MLLMPATRNVQAEFAPLLPFQTGRRMRLPSIAVGVTVILVAVLCFFSGSHFFSKARVAEAPVGKASPSFTISFVDQDMKSAENPNHVEPASPSRAMSFLDKKGKLEDKCPGCTDPTYRCVVTNDGTYAQCVDCSPYSNWRNDCPVWGEELRKAAVDKCGMACGSLKPPKGIRPAIEPYCQIGSLMLDYSHERCKKMEDDSIQVSCDSKDPNECGLQLSSTTGTGSGTYSVAMQAARGAGLSSRLYLYTYGLSKDRSKPWNEISFDVLGKSCSSNKTLISTDLVAGPFDEDASYWKRETSYQVYFWLPFDACKDWHTYTISIKNKNISWKVDDVVYRNEDISMLDDLIEALYERNLQTRLALVGQDENSGAWEEQGFLSQNEFEFPCHAWFANMGFYEHAGSSSEFESSDNSGSENATTDGIQKNVPSKLTNLSRIPKNIGKSSMQFLIGNITHGVGSDNSSESSDSEDRVRTTKGNGHGKSSDSEDIGKLFERIHSRETGHTTKGSESERFSGKDLDRTTKGSESDGSSDFEDVGKLVERIHSGGSSNAEDLGHTAKDGERDGSSDSENLHSSNKGIASTKSSDTGDLNKMIDELNSRGPSKPENNHHATTIGNILDLKNVADLPGMESNDNSEASELEELKNILQTIKNA